MSAPDRLLEAWAVLGAATADERAIRVEPTGVQLDQREVLAGLDVFGGRHLLVPFRRGEVREDRRSAGVQIRGAVLEEDGHVLEFVDVVCLVPRLNDLFAEVASDMLEALELDASDPVGVCHQVLERWRELLERPDPRLLGPQQLAGLFGELLVLRAIAEVDPHHATKVWTGPFKKQHDFMGENIAIEVKTSTTREGRVVEVHGAEQLEAPTGRTLYLAFVRVDVDPAGVSVPALIDVVQELGVDRHELHDRLSAAGYDTSKSAEYALPAFVERERRFYAVEGSFPRIISTSFVAGDVPAGVLRLRYDIDLTGEPPLALDEDYVVRILSAITATP